MESLASKHWIWWSFKVGGRSFPTGRQKLTKEPREGFKKSSPGPILAKLQFFYNQKIEMRFH
jgi:hypothetical protein